VPPANFGRLGWQECHHSPTDDRQELLPHRKNRLRPFRPAAVRNRQCQHDHRPNHQSRHSALADSGGDSNRTNSPPVDAPAYPGVTIHRMTPLTRREALTASAGLATTILGLPLTTWAQDQPAAKNALNVVVVGGHPDDPESGCGGTVARLVDLGHNVALLYLTRGEAGIRGKTHDEAAQIRTAEAIEACKILKARPLFAGQIDGAAEINPERYDAFSKILLAEKPDLVFTQWPIDSHRDHRAASLLAFDAWLKEGRTFALYYYEVEAGAQTTMFHPTHYVDITAVEERKRAACMVHKSQDPQSFYDIHSVMHDFRGREHGCKFAEAFVHHSQSKGVGLP
jgi:LmbE family N-acetylglucosaminyl deacetylase